MSHCIATHTHRTVPLSALRRAAPRRAAPHRAAPHRAALHHTALHRTALHRAAPHRAIPHRIAPHLQCGLPDHSAEPRAIAGGPGGHVTSVRRNGNRIKCLQENSRM